MIARAWRAWVALMDRREPPTALALVRIFAAGVMLCDYVWVHHVGLVDVMWSRFPDGFATGYSGWAASLGLDAFALWTIMVAALACALVGFATPIACIAYVLVSAQLSSISHDAESAIDVIMRLVFLVLALSRCNARWSVDGWILRRIGRPMPALVPAWPRYLLLLQLVWIYFSGGQNKSSHAWSPFGGFAALGNALLDPHTGRLDPELVSAVFPLTRVATAATMVFELTALFYLLWLYFAATRDRPGRLRRIANRARLRWIWLGLFVFFELGIAIGLRLGAFPYGMLALWPVLLLPDELERLGAWIRRRLRRASANGNASANNSASA